MMCFCSALGVLDTFNYYYVGYSVFILQEMLLGRNLTVNCCQQLIY